MNLIRPLSTDLLLQWWGNLFLTSCTCQYSSPAELSVSGEHQQNRTIDSIHSPNKVVSGALVFVGKDQWKKCWLTGKLWQAQIIVTDMPTKELHQYVYEFPNVLKNHLESTVEYCPQILIVSHLYLAMQQLLNQIDPYIERMPTGIHSKASIHPTSVVEGFVDDGVLIGPFCIVEKGATIGRGTVLEAHVTVMSGTILGENCRVQAGVVIGCQGFGFFGSEYIPIPHKAGVTIGNDCWIGANSVIAAGVLEPTKLGNHIRLDSFVQIAHNVELGDYSALASQAGIAGSTIVGERLRMGGNASIAGHLYIGNNVTIAAKSGVTKNIADGATVGGFPARPMREWLRHEAKR